MRRRPTSNPGQLSLDWEKDPAIQARIEELVAQRAEGQSFYWRLRLMMIESVLMGSLVIAAGMTLKQPTAQVITSGCLVATACLVSGMILIGLSALCAVGFARLRKRWAR